ncbi:Purple acid phosphatase N terminal domain-containing protein [Abeliophyllum distichum]|uniref:Purple acid phosphatase N terminal domain-containing protein n=1 Tax=Abeliophyllum distichum TaxID=126358 RepID=A0ABD1VZV3_9LAMI
MTISLATFSSPPRPDGNRGRNPFHSSLPISGPSISSRSSVGPSLKLTRPNRTMTVDHNPLPGTKHLLAESEEIRFDTSVGWRDPGYIHDEIMINLKKGKKYYYRVGSDLGWSDVFSFEYPNADSKETIAFMLGDM